MDKEKFKSGNMLYPLPVVMISCSDGEGNDNIVTVAWAGTVCTNPPMLSISVRPERYSYSIIEKTKEFVVNLTTEELAKATDFCGVRSGRNFDKFKEMNLTKAKGDHVNSPMILESPVNIECRVREIIKLGSHDMFLADVLAVHVNKQLMNEKGKLELNKSNPIVYSHGEYYGIGSLLGTFGYSVKKEIKKKDNKKQDINHDESSNKNFGETKLNESGAKRNNKKKSINKKAVNKKDTHKRAINNNAINNKDTHKKEINKKDINQIDTTQKDSNKRETNKNVTNKKKSNKTYEKDMVLKNQRKNKW